MGPRLVCYLFVRIISLVSTYNRNKPCEEGHGKWVARVGGPLVGGTWVVGPLVGGTWVVGPLVGETWVGIWAMGLAYFIILFIHGTMSPERA